MRYFEPLLPHCGGFDKISDLGDPDRQTPSHILVIFSVRHTVLTVLGIPYIYTQYGTTVYSTPLPRSWDTYHSQFLSYFYLPLKV
jgi:hypothetical protein